MGQNYPEDLGGFCAYLTNVRGLRPSSVEAYWREVRSFLSFQRGQLVPPAEALLLWLASKPAAPSTTTRRLAAVKAWAKWLREPDPTLDIDRPKKRKHLPRPVPNVAQQCQTLDPTMRLIALFLLESGLRIGEAERVDVKLPVPRKLMVRGKGDVDRLVPLTARARAALTALGGRLPYGRRAIQEAFHRAGFTPHRLRHTFATNAIAAGVPREVLQRMLGHASPATTDGYAAYAPKLFDEAREKIEGQP